MLIMSIVTLLVSLLNLYVTTRQGRSRDTTSFHRLRAQYTPTHAIAGTIYKAEICYCSQL